MTKAQVMALYPEGSYEIVPNDGMRKVVAARLTEAKQTIPHFYLTLDCKIDALMSAREQINAAAPVKDGKPAYKLSVNDFVMKAWAMALQKVPLANATWAVDSILYHKHPTSRWPSRCPAGCSPRWSNRPKPRRFARSRKRSKTSPAAPAPRSSRPPNIRAAALAVSNLGMFGITNFAAVINPPHGTILAVGAGEERVYADKGQVKIGQFMTVTLSCDHRAVDGALGAELWRRSRG